MGQVSLRPWDVFKGKVLHREPSQNLHPWGKFNETRSQKQTLVYIGVAKNHCICGLLLGKCLLHESQREESRLTSSSFQMFGAALLQHSSQEPGLRAVEGRMPLQWVGSSVPSHLCSIFPSCPPTTCLSRGEVPGSQPCSPCLLSGNTLAMETGLCRMNVLW